MGNGSSQNPCKLYDHLRDDPLPDKHAANRKSHQLRREKILNETLAKQDIFVPHQMKCSLNPRVYFRWIENQSCDRSQDSHSALQGLVLLLSTFHIPRFQKCRLKASCTRTIPNESWLSGLKRALAFVYTLWTVFSIPVILLVLSIVTTWGCAQWVNQWNSLSYFRSVSNRGGVNSRNSIDLHQESAKNDGREGFLTYPDDNEEMENRRNDTWEVMMDGGWLMSDHIDFIVPFQKNSVITMSYPPICPNASSGRSGRK